MSKNAHVPTFDQVIELPEPMDARISPDGRMVVYAVNAPDWDENAFVSQLWVVDSRGDGAPRRLTFAKQSSSTPRWSPDSTTVAFISQREGDKHEQIYRMSVLGGEAERLTELETDVQSIAWSPDGKVIAYTAVDPENAADKARKEKYGEYQVENHDYRCAHLWTYSIEHKSHRKVTNSKELHITGFEWHHSGNSLVISAMPSPDAKDFVNSQIFVVSLDDYSLKLIADNGADSPHWSPDGTSIAYSQMQENGFYKNPLICVYAMDSGEMVQVSTQFDGSPWIQGWGPQGIYFTALQRTRCPLFCLDLSTREITELTPEQDGWMSMEATFDDAFRYTATVYADQSHIYDAASIVLDGSRTVHRLSDINSSLDGWAISEPEVFRWESTDDTPIEGVLTRPIDFEEGIVYPLLVVIHGGPTWADLPALMADYARMIYPIQQWAAKGAFVLQPNYRGSIGYGEEFLGLNVRDLGVGDYEDVITGVDALIARGWVDGERVGAMGWSQGGYISMYISTFSDRFKAVSAGAGISNWMTYYVNTDIHPFTRQYLEATPWDDEAIYKKTSPMSYIKNAKTPTLIQHGEKDRRVPVPNAYELYQGLQDMGVEARLVVYPGMPHGPRKPRQRRHLMQDNWDWFNRWIWGEVPVQGAKDTAYVVVADSEQSDNEQALPALQRFASKHVLDVYHQARRDHVEFRIVSVQSGLMSPGDMIAADVSHELELSQTSHLSALIAEQLQASGLKKLTLFTVKASESASVLKYLGCLQIAAGHVGGVSIQHDESLNGSDRQNSSD